MSDDFLCNVRSKVVYFSADGRHIVSHGVCSDVDELMPETYL